MAAGVKGGTGRGDRGFTLIELMITVAVIGILSAIAYPSYKESVAKARRAQAVTALQTAAQYMERFYAENFRYDQNTAAVSSNDNTLFKSRPFVQSPPQPETKMYDITLTPAQSSMTITATPSSIGAMAGDRCGSYQLDQLGVKTLSGYDTTRFANLDAALAYCWK